MLKRPSNEKTGPANTKQVKRSSLPEQEHVSAYDPLAYDILKQHNCYWTFKQFENSAQVYVSGNDDDSNNMQYNNLVLQNREGDRGVCSTAI